MQSGSDVRVDVGAQIVALVGEIVDVAVLSEVAYGGVVACLFVAAGHSHVVLLGETGSEHLVDVVHVVPAIGRITVCHRGDILGGEVRGVLGAILDGSAGQLVHHVGHIIIVGELRAVHELREIGVHRHTERGVVSDGSLLLRASLGGDDHHTSGTFKTVDCRGGAILKD